MILHTQWDTTLIADAATGVEDVYSLKQIQTVIRPHSYPLLCQFLMKIIIVINLVCMCVKTSAEDNDFQSLSRGVGVGEGERERGSGGGGEREGERESVFYNFELLRLHVCTVLFLVVLYYRIKQQLNFLPGWIKYYVMLRYCHSGKSVKFLLFVLL